MRRALLALLLLVPAAPVAFAGGTAACDAIPHLPPTIGAFGQCTVQLTAGPGIMTFGVQAIAPNVGNLAIEATGPGASRVVVDCPLTGSSATCHAVFNAPAAGAWTVTGRAQVAFANDPWVRMVVNYP